MNMIKKKKTISLMLVLLLVLISFCFAGCKRKEKTLSLAESQIEVTGYSVANAPSIGIIAGFIYFATIPDITVDKDCYHEVIINGNKAPALNNYKVTWEIKGTNIGDKTEYYNESDLIIEDLGKGTQAFEARTNNSLEGIKTSDKATPFNYEFTATCNVINTKSNTIIKTIKTHRVVLNDLTQKNITYKKNKLNFDLLYSEWKHTYGKPKKVELYYGNETNAIELKIDEGSTTSIDPEEDKSEAVITGSIPCTTKPDKINFRLVVSFEYEGNTIIQLDKTYKDVPVT